LILVGLRRVRKGRVETRYLALEELDQPIGNGQGGTPADDPDTAASRLEGLGCDPKAVLEFLERQGVPRGLSSS
jgi:hypothetical protein